MTVSVRRRGARHRDPGQELPRHSPRPGEVLRAHPVTSTSSTGTSASPARSACPTSSRTACTRWRRRASSSPNGPATPARSLEFGVRFSGMVPVPDDDEGATIEVSGKVTREARGQQGSRRHRGAGRRREGADPRPRRRPPPVTPVPLADYTTLGLGGPAKAFTDARGRSRPDRRGPGRRRGRRAGAALGGGSNLVIADEGFPGTVVHVNTRGVGYAAAADGARRRHGRGGRGLGRRGGGRGGRGTRGRRAPVRHPRPRGRDSDPERRRLRPRGG